MTWAQLLGPNQTGRPVRPVKVLVEFEPSPQAGGLPSDHKVACVLVEIYIFIRPFWTSGLTDPTNQTVNREPRRFNVWSCPNNYRLEGNFDLEKKWWRSACSSSAVTKCKYYLLCFSFVSYLCAEPPIAKCRLWFTAARILLIVQRATKGFELLTTI